MTSRRRCRPELVAVPSAASNPCAPARIAVSGLRRSWVTVASNWSRRNVSLALRWTSADCSNAVATRCANAFATTRSKIP